MKISIITTTFNSGKTIRDTIESVLNQTYKDIEYIIKDGGSKDNTLKICHEYESLFEGRMKILAGKDKGIYDAMNQGISFATGIVIGILNSDDFFTSNDVIETVVSEMVNSELDAVYGDIHFVKPDNLNKCTRYFSSAYFRPWLLRFGFMPAHPSFYVRKEVYRKYGLYDLKYCTSSDFEMMVRLFTKFKIKAKYISIDFVTMRVGGVSTANLQSKKNVQNDIATSLKVHGIYSNKAIQCVRYVWRLIEVLYAKIKY